MTIANQTFSPHPSAAQKLEIQYNSGNHPQTVLVKVVRVENEQCWFIVEGQNFAASIFDTQDLSTIRGGSLSLRDLTVKAENALKAHFPGAVTCATNGGSVGIWQIEAAPAQVQAALKPIRLALERACDGHLAFGIAAVADDGTGYSRNRNRLRAALQRSRLAQIRVPFPNPDQSDTGVCPVDMVRPIGKNTKQRIGPTDADVIRTSASVHYRRRFGIEKKQTLIQDEIPEDIAESMLSAAAQLARSRQDRPFAMQTGSISEQAAPPDGLKANLADKICVIALDGNGFGKIQDAALAKSDTIEAQIGFDRALAAVRSKLIAQVFSRLIDEGGEGIACAEEREIRNQLQGPGSGEIPIIRFELLLWGGDEIMFIVPARIGWKILEQIGETLNGMTLMEQGVTFSVGAVFCHHDAPITRVKQLADDLCSRIKTLKPDSGGGRDGKANTLFMVEVLESFDHVGVDLPGHLARRVPKPLRTPFSPATEMAFSVLDTHQLTSFRCAAELMAEGGGGSVSRGRLRQTAYTLHRGAAPGAEYAGDKWGAYVTDTRGRLNGAVSELITSHLTPPPGAGTPPEDAQHFANARFFTIINEYWDYLTPIARAGK